MDRTAPPGEAGESDTAPAAPDARARARAYLDLWERQLVQVALAGPAVPARPAR